MNYLDELKMEFNGHIAFQHKRPGILQVCAPLFHEDGDMVSIFLDEPKNGTDKVRVSDYGLTLMRLSYNFELDTPNKLKIFHRILSENGVEENNGTLFLETNRSQLYPAILQFAQTVAKVSSMQLYKREVIQSLFWEILTEFIEGKLQRFNPRSRQFPLPDRDEYEVPFVFDIKPKPVYLFGVKDNSQARLAALSCLEFQRNRIPFTSCVVHEEFEDLTKKDRTRITNAADKQFTKLEEFQNHAEEFLERESMVQ